MAQRNNCRRWYIGVCTIFAGIVNMLLNEKRLETGEGLADI
jgi:hypothetical protein